MRTPLSFQSEGSELVQGIAGLSHACRAFEAFPGSAQAVSESPISAALASADQYRHRQPGGNPGRSNDTLPGLDRGVAHRSRKRREQFAHASSVPSDNPRAAMAKCDVTACRLSQCMREFRLWLLVFSRCRKSRLAARPPLMRERAMSLSVLTPKDSRMLPCLPLLAPDSRSAISYSSCGIILRSA